MMERDSFSFISLPPSLGLLNAIKLMGNNHFRKAREREGEKEQEREREKKRAIKRIIHTLISYQKFERS